MTELNEMERQLAAEREQVEALEQRLQSQRALANDEVGKLNHRLKNQGQTIRELTNRISQLHLAHEQELGKQGERDHLARHEQLAAARLLATIEAAERQAERSLVSIAADRLHDRLYRWSDRWRR